MTKNTKKIIVSAGIVICTLSSGCGSDTAGRHTNNSNNVEAVIEQQMAKSDNVTGNNLSDDIEQGKSSTDTYSIKEEVAKASDLVGSTEEIDVDLSVLSGNMVYSEVYNIMYYPEEYMGKTIKMRGTCIPYYDAINDKYYYACLIQDAAACCAQGIEFVLNDSYSIPEDYPEENAEIIVTGVFDVYEEDDGIYCTLRNANLG